MINKLVLTAPIAALSLLTIAAGTIATGDSAEAAVRGCGYHRTCHLPDCVVWKTCPNPLPRKQDRPIEKRK